jgi:putative ABC transport system permease protein
MKILAGRNFSTAYTNDADTAIVITASAARLLGFVNIEEAVGSTLTIDFGGQEGSMNVIGIVNDFHQVSLKEAVEPIAIFLSPFGSEYYAMKVSTQNLPTTIEYVQSTWNEVFPGNPFSYFFLDDYFNRQYQTDQRFGKLFGVFAALALFVGGLGLLGLSAFTTQQRTKEIGIRKVLGASVQGIVLLLSKDFVQLLIIANLVAWPLIYFVMEQWLTQFAYRIDVGWWVLAASGLIVIIIALFTVSLQTIKAAVVNPVDSLKNE